MYPIKNKLASYKLIKELGINHLAEQIFQKNEEEKIKDFIAKNPAKYYAIRDKSSPSGLFKFKVPKDCIFKETMDYSLFSINVSSANYTEHQLLVGEILFLSTNEVYATLTTQKTASVRDALAKPEFNIQTNIYDKKLNKIVGLDYLYNYAIKNNLIDTIIEFSLFDIEVGVKNERIVVYELRNIY